MDIASELKLSSYEYDLPPELVAQEPPEERGRSRLMVLNRAAGKIEHRSFADIADYLSPGDCLAVNRTKVLPARLFGKKETGGKVEALFLDPAGVCSPAGGCRALLRPFLPAGKKISFPDGLSAEVRGKNELGEALLELSGPALETVLERYGLMPLPPYIKRKDGKAESMDALDRERYQTVYAREKGSIAAPTAGLHFTGGILAALKGRGVEVAEITLHVGWGTFRPVTAEDVSRHRMLPEYCEISAQSAGALRRCKARGGRLVAVGTTSVRTLESAAVQGFFEQRDGAGFSGETSLFVRPGFSFKAVDAMVTNFHLPHSTPLLMVCALAGRETILAAYREAAREKYRFYSYGDAMLIL